MGRANRVLSTTQQGTNIAAVRLLEQQIALLQQVVAEQRRTNQLLQYLAEAKAAEMQQQAVPQDR